ncbi:MAG: hypothetical protein ABWX82_07385 [Leifsonia sp.]
MGSLFYVDDEFEFDDRTLAHLQIVISTKLRRGENFFLAWTQPMERGSGRNSIWIDNGVPIRFFYSGSRPPSINRDWVEALVLSAGRASGLLLGEEPTESRPGS